MFFLNFIEIEIDRKIDKIFKDRKAKHITIAMNSKAFAKN